LKEKDAKREIHANGLLTDVFGICRQTILAILPPTQLLISALVTQLTFRELLTQVLTDEQ